MPVTLVIGRSGSGKTQHCFDAIQAAMKADPLGPPIFWILPRQATFDAERMLTCESDLGGFCRARVLSFARLGREIFGECGGSAIPEVTAQGRQMILSHLLRQHKTSLRFYGGVARQVGLAAQLDLAFAELERNGKGVEDLNEVLERLEADADTGEVQMTPLRDKLHDLNLIYREYVKFLGQGRLDQHQRARQVEEYISKCSLVREGAFYVDGFLDFTAHERTLLAGIARSARAMTITLMMDPASKLLQTPHTPLDSMAPFFRTEQTYRKLHAVLSQADVQLTQPIRLTSTPRFKAAAIEQIERHFFEPAPAPFVDPARAPAVERIEASDGRGEVDAVARRIRALVSDREAGIRLRDIIVLARNFDSYHAQIAGSFSEHGIAWFADRRRSGAHHPLLRVVRSLFQIVRQGWRQDAVMSLLRSGLLTDINDYAADALENYLSAHQIRGASAWEASEPWQFHRRVTDEEADEAAIDPPVKDERDDVERMRRALVEKLKPMRDLAQPQRQLTVRAIATAVYKTMDELGAPQVLAGWITTAREAEKKPEANRKIQEAGEHQQVWANLAELFQQMVDLLGDEQVELAEFVDVLEAGLEQFDLALTPPTVDQVVVGQVDRTRSPRVRVAFVLGLNEGSFPASLSESSILSDRERQILSARSLELDADLKTRAMDEHLLGYIAMTRAGQQLILSRPAADPAGKAVAPSMFWRQIGALVPEAQVQKLASLGAGEVDHIATPRQLTNALMRWVRDGADSSVPAAPDAEPSPWPALYQWFATQACDEGAMDVARRDAWRALSYVNAARLDPQISAQLFHRDLVASASQIEVFAACPFKHFARYGLGLRPPPRGDLRPSDLGPLYHRVLERAMRQALREDVDASPEQISQSMIRAASTELGDTLRRALRLSEARTQYLLQRTQEILSRFIRSEQAMTNRSNFRPAFTSVRFGSAQQVGPVTIATPGGARAALQGAIDRVDVLTTEDADAMDQTPVVVVDYRQGARSLSLDEAFHGLSLGLLVAMLALQEEGEQLARRPLSCVGALYHLILRPFQNVKHPEENKCEEADASLGCKPRGIFSLAHLMDLDSTLTPGSRSKVVSAGLKKDGTLGWRSESDALEPEEFEAVLSHVRKLVAEKVDAIVAGVVDVKPFLMGTRSACPGCEYRDVCRFQKSTNRYNTLEALGRQGVIEKLLPGSAEASDDD